MSLQDVERAFPFADAGQAEAEAIEDDRIAARALSEQNKEIEKPLPIPDQPMPYMSSRGKKSPSEWGTPDYILTGARRYPGLAPGPWMPQLSDVRDLVKRNALFFAQNGSRPTQKIAASMFGHSDKWWSEFAKGRHAQAQESLSEYRLQQDKLVANEQHQFRLLADAFKAYEKDPAKLRNALINLTYRFDDPVLRDVIQSQGLARAEDLISARHNNNLDQLKIIHQREQNAKLEEAKGNSDDVLESIRQLADPDARSPTTQTYLDTGQPEIGALPSTDPARYSTDPLAPKSIEPLNLPHTTPATSADQTHPVPPPFPTGVTPLNYGARRGELTDWATRVGVPIPPPDAAGMSAWLAANAPSGPVVSPTGTSVPAPAPGTPAAPQAPDSPDIRERNRIAALAGYSGDQLDRYAWDYFMYGRLPHTGAIPKDLQSLYQKQNEAVRQRATGPNGIEEWIHRLYSAIPPGPLGMSERESVARADQILEKIRAVRPEIANQIGGFIHGFTALPTTSGFAASQVGVQRMRELVYAIDPTFKPTRNEAVRATVRAFSGNGQIGQRLLAFKTAIKHAGTVMSIIDQMPNTPITDWNRFINNISTRLGSAKATEFNTAFNLFSTEVARAFRGSQTTLSEITHIRENLNVNSSPAQLRAGMRAMAELMQGQLDSIADQWNFSTMEHKRGQDFFDDPNFISEFNKLRELPFPSGSVGFKPAGSYIPSGNVQYNSDLPNEAAALNGWLAANPTSPKAAAVREKLRSLGWLSKGNE
jgi:hypothetical protein